MKRFAAAAVLLAIAARPAEARSTLTITYAFADVWPTAVRFLRIDRGCPIREKDEASGYILFDYVEGTKDTTKVFKGSLELVRGSDSDGREIVQMVMTLPDLPRHYEAMLLDKLTQKVREERGSPLPPPPKRPPESSRPRQDAGPGDNLPRLPTLPDLPR